MDQQQKPKEIVKGDAAGSQQAIAGDGVTHPDEKGSKMDGDSCGRKGEQKGYPYIDGDGVEVQDIRDEEFQRMDRQASVGEPQPARVSGDISTQPKDLDIRDEEFKRASVGEPQPARASGDPSTPQKYLDTSATTVENRQRVADNVEKGKEGDGRDSEAGGVPPLCGNAPPPVPESFNDEEAQAIQHGAFAASFGGGVERVEAPSYSVFNRNSGTGSSTELEENATSPSPEGTEEGLAEAKPVGEEEEAPKTSAQFYDMESAKRKSEERKEELMRQGMCVLWVCGVLGFLAIALAVGLGWEGRADNMPTTAPSLYPSTSPSAAPSLSLERILVTLPEHTQASLQDPFSPQTKAFDWLRRHKDISTMEERRMKQLLALASFYYAWDGENWPMNIGTDWLNDEISECLWYSGRWGQFYKEGYKMLSYAESPCNERDEYTALELSGHKSIDFPIYEGLPPELALLTSLDTIRLDNQDLMNISFAELFPEQLTELTNLRVLELDKNSLIGSIPSYLWNMTQLQELVIRENSLAMQVPTELGLLTNVEKLEFGANLLVGEVPSELGMLTKLTTLDMSELLLQGSLPTEVGLLTNLSKLKMESSSLSGPLPTQLGLLTRMTGLTFANNQLRSSVPSELGAMAALEVLVLSNASLTGTLPPALGNSVVLKYVDLSHNPLTSSIPSALGRLTNLLELHLRNTELTGSIPQEIGSLVDHTLHVLDLTYSFYLSGSIPGPLCELNHECSYFPLNSKSSDTASREDDPEDCIFSFMCGNGLCGCTCDCST